MARRHELAGSRYRRGGIPCDFFLSGAYGVNQDGSLAVGLLYLATLCRANAGTWDLTNGDVTVLPAEFGETAYTRANAVNADGSVIVGWQDQPTGERTAAKWVKGVEEVLLTPDGSFNGEATPSARTATRLSAEVTPLAITLGSGNRRLAGCAQSSVREL